MKMTFQPKKRQRSQSTRLQSKNEQCWRQVAGSQKSKRKKEIIRIGRSFVGLFSLWRQFHEIYAVVGMNRQFQEVYKRRFSQQVFGHAYVLRIIR